MKTLLTLLSAMMIVASSVQARVGETEEQIKARYGDGKPAGKTRIEGAVTFQFSKGAFQIEVVMLAGKSICEVIHKKEGGNFTDKEVKEILDAMPESGKTWRHDKRDKRWERSGKPALIAYREPGHDDFFFIKDLEACTALDKKNRAIGF